MKVYIQTDLCLYALIPSSLHLFPVSISSAVLCKDGAMRLAGGSSDNIGRIEVCRGSQWGTVCLQGSSSPPEPGPVCKTLGYSGDSESLSMYVHSRHFMHSYNTSVHTSYTAI